MTCRVSLEAIGSVPHPSAQAVSQWKQNNFSHFKFLTQTKDFAVNGVWFYCLFVSLFSLPVPPVPLYGYGARENDQEYVERRVDFNSPLFKPETGFPFGKTLRSSLYVSLLGLDSLGKRPSPEKLGEAPGTRCLGWDSCRAEAIGMLLWSICSRR